LFLGVLLAVEISIDKRLPPKEGQRALVPKRGVVFSPILVRWVIRFLEEWRHGRSEDQNQIARIENDLNFMAVFGTHPDTRGVVIRDGEKVIAYSIFAPYFKDACIGLFGKVLRGYENLGVVLTVEKCKEMHRLGFKYAYLANMKNDFKRGLLWAGKEIEVYSELWHENPGIKRGGKITTEEYLNVMTG
jgi:hypothetical protein